MIQTHQQILQTISHQKKQQQREEDGCPAEGRNTVNQYWTWSSCLKITANFLHVFPNLKIPSHLEAINTQLPKTLWMSPATIF